MGFELVGSGVIGAMRGPEGHGPLQVSSARWRRPLSLRLNSAWTLVGNGVYAASQWGMLVLLAKLLRPSLVGSFALALAITAPIITFAGLHLRVVQATDARDEYAFGAYLGVRLATSALALLAIGGVILVSGYRGMTGALIAVVGLAKVFESISDVYYGLAQKRERMDRIAKSLMMKGPLSLLALGGTVLLTHSLLWGAASLVAVWAGLLLLYDSRNRALFLGGETARRQRVLPGWDARELARLSWIALPMGAVQLVNSLGSNVPRYFIQHDLGGSQLGIYAAMAYLIVAGNLVVLALGDAAYPRLAQYYASGERRLFGGLLLKLVGLGAGLGAAGVLVSWLLGRTILTLLYRPVYSAHADVLVWLSIGATLSFVISFLGVGMTAARHFRVQVPLTVVALALTAAACAFLVPRFQLIGAATAGIIGLSFQLTGSLVVLAHAMRVPVGHPQRSVGEIVGAES